MHVVVAWTSHCLLSGRDIGTLMATLELVTLLPSMARTAARQEATISLIDGPVPTSVSAGTHMKDSPISKREILACRI
jgi:hypothetical protein